MTTNGERKEENGTLKQEFDDDVWEDDDELGNVDDVLSIANRDWQRQQENIKNVCVSLKFFSFFISLFSFLFFLFFFFILPSHHFMKVSMAKSRTQHRTALTMLGL